MTTRFRSCLLGLAVLVGVGTVPAAPSQAQPPGMPDPRRMSGIPRPDPKVAPGTVTVRCLLGGFSEPATGIEVVLQVESSDGESSEQFTAETNQVGRATFSGLEPFIGGRAVATTELGGAPVRSGPIELRQDMGSRVLLVRGAEAPPAPAGPGAGGSVQAAGSPHGGTGDVPPPGEPFPIEGHEPGTLVVGTLDLRERGRAESVEVTLTITPSEAEPITRTAKSDEQGRAVFRGLRPPEIPEGSTLQVSAQIDPGAERQTSKPFQMGEQAMAVYLAEGFEAMQARRQPASGQAPQGRPKLPGPRGDPDLPGDVVRVRVVDGEDNPVASQTVEVWAQDVTRNKRVFRAETNAEGIAHVSDIPVRGDEVYFVGVPYQGAPYQTSFFEMSGRNGIAVDVRVFPVTDDASRIRSAVQFQLLPRENDTVQVFQFVQLVVEGEQAFWPDGGLKVAGAEGTKSFQVHPRANAWLEHEEGVPFATLTEPIPPGEFADLSVVYLLEHDGTVEVEWTPPVPVVDASVVLPEELALEEPEVQAEPVPDGQQHAEDVSVYKLGQRPAGASLQFAASGLPGRSGLFQWLAVGAASALLLALGLGLAVRPTRDRRQRLQQRREQLLQLLQQTESKHDRDRLLLALDRIYRQLDALEAGEGEETRASAERAKA